MPPIVSSFEIARPPDEVYSYATDPTRFAEWQDDVLRVRMEGGRPPGVGTRFTTTRRIGRVEQTTTQEGPPKLVLDLEALSRVPEAAPVQRFVRSIIVERGDYNGRVLTIRRDDLRAICALLQTDISEAVSRLEAWGALVESPSTLS